MRQEIEMTCLGVGIIAGHRGWTEPRPKRGVPHFQLTPELVHGVAIAGGRPRPGCPRAALKEADFRLPLKSLSPER
ncbi:hypothetical protein ACIHFD_26990 [Nonomuraea sp. NPDC051941]|uniref:hypothetical protein n=1 Tax=Nonomuraea sp. NPDC051941 TaxID=3364373 RepID=UPI0037C984F6